MGTKERGKRETERERSMVVEKVRETRPGDIPPVKGGLVGGGDESSASPSIVFSATHFPTYTRVHAREACPRARLPAVNPAECRERRLYLPPSSCLLPSFLPSESLNSIPRCYIEMETLGVTVETVGDTLLQTKKGNVIDIDPWEKR